MDPTVIKHFLTNQNQILSAAVADGQSMEKLEGLLGAESAQRLKDEAERVMKLINRQNKMGA